MKHMEKEKQWIRKVARYDRIIIYGAGLVGGLTAKRLLANCLGHKVVGFAVSEHEGETSSREKVNGLYVYEIQELKSHAKDALVIIATMPVLHDVIIGTLQKNGFERFQPVTRKLYDSFCRNYITEFRRAGTVSFPENTRKRILFLASDNNRTSGAFLCMTELCEMIENRRKKKEKNGQADDAFAVLVILPEYGTGEELLIQKGIPYTYIPSRDWGYEIARDHDWFAKVRFAVGQCSNYKAKKELIRLMREQSVSLVHCNTTYTYVGALAAKACGIPVVWHLRENMENQGYRLFARKWALRLIQSSEKVIAVSEYIKNLMKFEDSNLICTIYDAVEKKTDVIKKRDLFGKQTVQMIVVGVVAPFKGQKELVEACSILKERNFRNFHLRIVGAGDQKYVKELQKMAAEFCLERQIEFYGVSRNVYELYEQSDIAFTCGAKEAYGRVTIEALLSGCLVIGVNSGATSELIRDGETGFLYEPGNARSLADCIQKAVSHLEQSRVLARSGQDFARKTFTKENNFRQILEIYQEVLKR